MHQTNKSLVPEIISTSKIDLPFKTNQSEFKEFAREIFSSKFDDIDRILESFDNTLIETRNISVPVDYFKSDKTFKEKNDLFIELALKYSIEAIEKCLTKSEIKASEITDIVFITSTGISTPSIDALIINKMKLNPLINRTPVWGLGCAGGVSGLAKANTIAIANPKAVVMLVSVELCSLTFIKDDLSKSNLIATGLFSDGVSAVLITGDEIKSEKKSRVRIMDSQSKLYFDTLDIMGWDITDEGFKVVFSKDIPAFISKIVKNDITDFLNINNLKADDIKYFIVHPGGKKVIDAYVDSLEIDIDKFHNTVEILKNYGNMSSATVLYVLDKFMGEFSESGIGIMMSLGPGFSSELLLLEININPKK